MDKSDKISFMGACKDFFGFHPDQPALAFAKEIKALPNPDRVEIADGLTKNGYNIDPTTIVTKTAQAA